jgi:hypothetical protein
VLTRHREPFAADAFDLQAARKHSPLEFLGAFGTGERGQDAMTTPLFRLAQ